MYQDLHSHTYFSACGADEPERLIVKAIESGIDILGITDHNYGIGTRKQLYFNLLTDLQKEYCGADPAYTAALKLLRYRICVSSRRKIFPILIIA